MIKAQIFRINRFLTEVTEVAISFENAFIAYLANLCLSLTGNTAIGLLSNQHTISEIPIPLSPMFLVNIFGVLGIPLIIAFHPLRIAFGVSYSTEIIGSKLFNVLLSKLLVVLTSTCLAVTLIPIFQISAFVKLFIGLLVEALCAYFSIGGNKAVRGEGLQRSIFPANFTGWFHSVLQSFVIMKITKRLEFKTGGTAFFGNGNAELIEKNVDSGVVYYLHGKSPIRFAVASPDATCIDASNVDTTLWGQIIFNSSNCSIKQPVEQVYRLFSMCIDGVLDAQLVFIKTFINALKRRTIVT